MKEIAFVKKYKPLSNLIKGLICSFIPCFVFFILLCVYGFEKLDELAGGILVFSIIYLWFIITAIQIFIDQKKFNKEHHSNCAVKYDKTTGMLYMINTNEYVLLDRITNLSYRKISNRDVLGAYSSKRYERDKRDYSKSNLGNLELKLSDDRTIIVERIINIEDVYKKLNELLKL